MSLAEYPLSPNLGERFTAIYRGGPLNDQYENRESVGGRPNEITLDDDVSGGRYVISSWDGNGRDGIWFYVWIEATA